MKQRTKIICTLGPAVGTREKIQQLIESGMNVARINCSHGSWEERTQWIKWIRELNPKVAPIGILIDLQGPKFRIGEVRDEPRKVEPGQVLTLSRGVFSDIHIPQKEIYEALSVNDRVLIGDGEVELLIVSKIPAQFDAKVVSGGLLRSNKGITIIGKSFSVPSLTEKDIEDLRQAAILGADYIALSYVRDASDLRQLRRLVDQYNPKIQIGAKIETKAALANLDAILKVTDFVMVARGDLGLQLDLESVPVAQKLIISRSTQAGRPVITATQMLESMLHSSRPTRAEATDIANAVLDGTDAIMLSGETAVGEYPIEAVKIMSKIAKQAEIIFDYQDYPQKLMANAADPISSTEAVALAAVQLATSIKAKAIITTTTSGFTARMVSRFRPSTPIFCASWDSKTQAQMAVIWGVNTIHIPVPTNTDEVVSHAIRSFVEQGYLKPGDTVVATAGVPAGTPGNTNLILVQVVKR